MFTLNQIKQRLDLIIDASTRKKELAQKTNESEEYLRNVFGV
jgi:hypothetical protein